MTATAMSAKEHDFYLVSEVARRWRVSEDTVRRRVWNEPGVLHISQPRLLKHHRKQKPHVMLRIPPSVVARIEQQWSAGLGPEVKLRRRRV